MQIKQTRPVNIELLRFDSENPRIPSSVDGSDSDAVINWMLKSANLVELMGSIAEKGFFPAEPLLVVPGQDNGTFAVVEGNRRYAALYVLNGLASNINVKTSMVQELINLSNENGHDLENIPVLQYEEKSEIEEYLGYRHITGVKAWSPMAKARYLKMLQTSVAGESIEEQYKSLARTIGSKSNHVRLLLVGLEVAEKIKDQQYYQVQNLDDTNLDFGVLYTALAKDNISSYVGVRLLADNPLEDVDVEKLGELTKWMFEKDNQRNTRLGESRNLSDLDLVLGNESALAHFKTGATLAQSVKLTLNPYASFQDTLRTVSDDLSALIDGVEDLEEDLTPDLAGARLIRDKGTELYSKVVEKIS